PRKRSRCVSKSSASRSAIQRQSAEFWIRCFSRQCLQEGDLAALGAVLELAVVEKAERPARTCHRFPAVPWASAAWAASGGSEEEAWGRTASRWISGPSR